MDRIDEALAALALQDIPNYKRTAIEYGVNRTTLSRRHRGLCKSRGEAKEYQCLLSHQQQKVLVEHINSLSEAGIPLHLQWYEYSRLKLVKHGRGTIGFPALLKPIKQN